MWLSPSLTNNLQLPAGSGIDRRMLSPHRLRAYVFASHSSESRFFAGRERASAPSWHSTRESYWWPSYGSSQTQLQTVNGFLLLSCTSHAKPVAEGTLVSTRGASTGQPYRYRHLQGHWFSQPHSRAVTANTSPALVGVLGISVFKCSRLLVVQGTPVTRRAGDQDT